MSGLRTVAGALLLVLLDLRIDGLDLLPDPLGWAVAAWVLGGLAGRHRGFDVAAAAAAVACVASVPGLVGPGPDWLWPVTTAATTALVFAACTAVRALVPTEAVRAERLRWADLGLTGALVLLTPFAEGQDWLAAPVLLLGLAALVVFVLFLLMLARAGRSGEGASGVVGVGGPPGVGPGPGAGPGPGPGPGAARPGTA